MIAVDDSESMQKSQAGDMALRALATLANGMSQLEIGQLGIASYGDDMRLLHPFNIPFTSESGVNIVQNFKFNAKRTRTALCVESSIAALVGASSVSSSMQLVFMISDGRIERDSRSKLRRLIRQMAESNMLMVMIIVEGEENGSSSKSSESILNMKEVSFVNEKPQIKHFIEDYFLISQTSTISVSSTSSKLLLSCAGNSGIPSGAGNLGIPSGAGNLGIPSGAGNSIWD